MNYNPSYINHSFNVGAAMKVGVTAAVLLTNIHYWVIRNEANQANFHDGRYWTYNSVAALHELFPYLSTKQVRTALKKLEDCGLVVTGCYNKNPYDRTKWYALTAEGYEMFGGAEPDSQDEQTDLPTVANENADGGQPIPNINTYINTERYNVESDAEKVIDHLNDRCGRQFRKNKTTLKEVSARLKDGYSQDTLCAIVDLKAQQWENDKRMSRYLRPSTLFNATNCANYEQELQGGTPTCNRFEQFAGVTDWAQV